MTDLEAGEKAEIKNLIHVKTGHEKERKEIINNYKSNKRGKILKQPLKLLLWIH